MLRAAMLHAPVPAAGVHVRTHTHTHTHTRLCAYIHRHMPVHTHTHACACPLLSLKYVRLMKRLTLTRAFMKRELRKRLGREYGQ